MKTCGQVAVDVPECVATTCHPSCDIVETCRRQVVVDWGDDVLTLPGPTCPAFDSVPNPWADIPGFEDRPWNDEAEDALIEAQLERMNKRPTEFPWVGVYKSYPCTKEQAEEAVAVLKAFVEAQKEEAEWRACLHL